MSELRSALSASVSRRFDPRGWGRVVLAGAALVVLTLVVAVPAAGDDDVRLKRLVETIAKGDEVESAAASEQLIDQLTGPLARAIGSLDDRSAEEQVRLREVLARLSGALRMRVFRLDLPAADRALFDDFARAYPELVRRAFDGNYRIRRAAVDQIPLEPDTGAGVLIAAKVNDEDGDVAYAALEVAARLHDKVIARNLVRYISDATEAVRSGFYGPEDADLAQVVAVIVQKSALIVGKSSSADGVPTLVNALRFFGHSKYWDSQQRASVIRALGRLGDDRVVPVLLPFLDDEQRVRWNTPAKGKLAIETVGDVALVALARVYKLDPARFGVLTKEGEGEFAGYADDKSRREGHRAFLIWQREHAPAPASSQPTSREHE